MTTPAKPSVVSFGACEFNLNSKDLRGEGIRVRLEGQPLAILQVRLDGPRELGTREELPRGSNVSAPADCRPDHTR